VRYEGTDSSDTMIPNECYDGTDSCAILVSIRRYCQSIITKYYS